MRFYHKFRYKYELVDWFRNKYPKKSWSKFSKRRLNAIYHKLMLGYKYAE